MQVSLEFVEDIKARIKRLKEVFEKEPTAEPVNDPKRLREHLSIRPEILKVADKLTSEALVRLFLSLTLTNEIDRITATLSGL